MRSDSNLLQQEVHFTVDYVSRNAKRKPLKVCLKLFISALNEAKILRVFSNIEPSANVTVA